MTAIAEQQHEVAGHMARAEASRLGQPARPAVPAVLSLISILLLIGGG